MITVRKSVVSLCVALMLLPALTGCGPKKQTKEQDNAATVAAPPVSPPGAVQPSQPAQLPVRYQSPGYLAPQEKAEENLGDIASEYQIKVGATIRSTTGPQPLWDVLKRLANLKGMTVSWSSDVDQNIPVDVDISAKDSFFDAVANLLRQADYFHEVKGKNIIVRNKTTKVFKIALPPMQGSYTSTVGGNFLSSSGVEGNKSGTEGSVKIASPDNKFNVWEMIENNLKIILQTAETERKDVAATSTSSSGSGLNSGEGKADKGSATNTAEKGDIASPIHQAARYSAKDSASFVIDKNIGLITVTAKPNVLLSVESYINNIKKHLFRQVNIEAKIIEVYLQDNSKIGLDWTSVLKNFQVTAVTSFGNAGQVYPYTTPDKTQYANTFVSRVVMPPLNFSVLLNALNEQGDAHVLANPKLTVLNGQPALISVGKDVAYIKEITRDVEGTGADSTTTYSTTVGNVVQGVSLGVLANVLDDKKVVLHLTPITTDIANLDSNGAVMMTTIGDGAIQLGLPQVRVREMSTMVEVSDGELLVIGGLIDSIETNKGAFAPGVGSIPGIRYLFGVEEKTMQKRELVILLTPKII